MQIRFKLIAFLLLVGLYSSGQDSQTISPVICHGEHTDAFTELRQVQFNQQSRTTLSDISVTYVDFPEAAQNSFEKAVQIWESIIVSPQKIKIKAEWKSLTGTTLAQSGATKIYRNFPTAPYRDVWYPAALAEAISGQNLNATEDEMTITLNKNINWSYDLTGNAQQGRFDMTTVVLHEIAHGIGFNSSFGLTDDAVQGKWGQTLIPYIFDLFVQNSQLQTIKDTKIFGNPSVEIKEQITSNDLFFFLGTNIYIGQLPQLSAVNPFREGASISHLDEFTYSSGNDHSLMTPSIRSAEVIHYPGDLTLLILNQIGWGIKNLPISANLITASEQPETYQILTFPNPVSDELTIIIPTSVTEKSEVYVADILGRKVFSKTKNTATNSTISIDVSSWQTGLYFVIITIDGKTTSKTIVVTR